MIVHIETANAKTGDPATGYGTRITTPSGEPLHGVTAITVHIPVNAPVTAEVTLLSGFVGSANSSFVMRDPISGEMKSVRRIEFHDGSRFEAEKPSEISGSLFGEEA